MIKLETGQVVRSRRRTVALVITQDARLEIRAPLHASLESIETFVAKKSSWITRKITEVAARPKPPVREYVHGEEFPYLGEYFALSVVDGADVPFLFDRGFRLAGWYRESVKDLLIDWYKYQASAVIKERVDLFSSIHGIKYEKFKITGGRSRWGSCARRGDLSFSWRLIMAPLHAIDYVIVHELAHVSKKDHSRQFWGHVAGLFPGYRESAKWLKDNGHLLTGII